MKKRSNQTPRSTIPTNSALVRVRVHTDSRKETFVQKTVAAFEVTVKEPARNNQANARVRLIIARHFHVAVQKVVIVAGHRTSNKTIRIHTKLNDNDIQ